MLSFSRIHPSDEEWNVIESSYDSTVFHSKGWNNFLQKTLVQPFIVRVQEADKVIGYFIGTKFGLCFHNVAAPIEGTGTYTQGLCFLQPVTLEKRLSVYNELADWIFSNKIASLFQVDDWNLRDERDFWIDPQNIKFPDKLLAGGRRHSHITRPTLFVNLNKSEDELWSSLSYKSCKYCINKARKKGLYINVIDQFGDIKRFTDNHYKQVIDVCRRHGNRRPKVSQSLRRMRLICESLFPNRVLMLEVIGSDEQGRQCIMSSGIFCYDKGESIYYTGASEQKYMRYCPNELMVWEAMRILHSKGVEFLNFGGMASYKLKFGTKYAFVHRIYYYKHPLFYKIKLCLFRAYHYFRNFHIK